MTGPKDETFEDLIGAEPLEPEDDEPTGALTDEEIEAELEEWHEAQREAEQAAGFDWNDYGDN